MTDLSDTLAQSRRQARETIGANQRLGLPSSDRAHPVRGSSDRREAVRDMVDPAMAGLDKALDEGGELILRNAPAGAKAVKFFGKRMLGAPSAVLDLAEVAQAKDRKRALAGLAGSTIGQIGGGALGSVAGPPGAVAGAVGGSYAGEKAGEYLYDHYPEMRDRVVQDFGQAVTRGWGPVADGVARRGLLGPSW